jgi:glyoxylase-like metal-dependent hydrolase (beta-lactamase superfamily II)
LILLKKGKMKISKIETGNFMLDGGAMFGVVPKSLWQKAYPANENNMCNLALRSLYIEDGDRKILCDVGLGKKQDEKFFGYYYLNGDDSLEKSIDLLGIHKEEITDVILSHLHFDHCGGAVEYDDDRNFNLTFPNAIYWCSKQQWEWAMKPNLREKPSYLKENIIPLADSGKLKLFDSDLQVTSSIGIKLYNGHTQGLAVTYVAVNGRTIVYVADMIPTAAHIPSSWVCGFDTQPLVSFEERQRFLSEASEKNYILFFEHDRYTECCTVHNTEKGIRLKESFSLKDFLGEK